MIAQVVFDLPLDGPFDYLIPEHLIPEVVAGSRVKVSFGPKTKTGFVVGLLDTSSFSRLKPVLSLCDDEAVFDSMDLIFARDFCASYGCSLGEALGTILRNKKNQKPSIRREHKPAYSFYRCPPGSYAGKIQKIIDEYRGHSKNHFQILVPDAFRGQMLASTLKGEGPVKIGTRSSVFECDGRQDCVIMVDEEDPSYKQESMPMYETRQVLLARSKIYGFDVAFVGISPSVEMMAQAREGEIKFIEDRSSDISPVRMVDLSNYKFVPGLISPPVRDALQAALINGKKSILVLNRKGSYRLTRCVDCAEILKCIHCDSPLIYSRSVGKFLCRHCTYTIPGDTECPKCHKPSWRSMGIGVEQVQSELKKLFPQAKIHSFSRAAASEKKQTLPDFDILISTQAVLRFQGTLKAHLAAFIDFDAELNRLDMRSAFNAFSLALHISSMALEGVFIQTRNSGHYVLQSLARGKIQDFYDEEFKLRKEFGFSPFKHWVKINWRGKAEKSTHQAAEEVYNILIRSSVENNCTVTPPLADAVGRKRDQFRYNVMVQADQAAKAVAYIKTAFAQVKRRGRVIVTMNVDP
jgi:primosomal protein N' (replication factor Y)